MRSHVAFKKKEKDYTLYSQKNSWFANPLAAILESPYLLPYTVPLDLRYCFLLQSCMNIIVIQIKCSFCLQGYPSLLIVDFNHCWKPGNQP
jgi:hypothetical protein